IDALRTPSLLVIDPSTHHGTGELGEVGAPYGGSPSDQLNNAGALGGEPPPGEDIAWLNRWVKGIRNGINHRPRVRYLDLGDRTWHAARSWRSVDTHLNRLYLSAQPSGSAPLSPNDGTLARSVPSASAAYQDSYAYSPTTGAS